MMATLFLPIVVKAPAGFPSQVARQQHALLNRVGAESRIMERGLVERLRGGKVDVDADQVHELERTHGETARLLHNAVYRQYLGLIVAQDAQGFVVKGTGDPVDDEARRVLGRHRSEEHTSELH